MNCSKHRAIAVAFRSVVELAAVVALVLGMAWGAATLGEVRHRQPVRPDSQGVIRLDVRKSAWRGNVEYVEVGRFSGAWRCRDGGRVWWRLAVDSPRTYRVEVKLSSP